MWDLAGSKPGLRAELRTPVGGFRSLAFAPNSRVLAAGSASGSVSLFDVSEKAAPEVRVLRGGAGSIDALAFSPDGKQVAGAGEDHTLRVWEPGTGTGGEARALLAGHTRPIRAVAFAPDGHGAATAARDGTARVWALSRIRSSQRAELPHGGEAHAVTYSPDGKTAATAGSDALIRLWDLTVIKPTVRAELPGHAGGTRLVLIAPDAAALVSVGTGGEVIHWDLRSGAPRRVWEAPAGAAASVALTPDGRYLARGLADGAVEVHRVAEKRT